MLDHTPTFEYKSCEKSWFFGITADKLLKNR
nr:MAG TPA: hypothetical protein [Caudoviricetes sp.]